MKKEVYSGLIVKHEKLIPIDLSNMENICIAEANNPYSDYYGRLPQRAKPNSLFIFTKHFYYLEEIISYAQKVEKCLFEQINIASAILEMKGKQFPAIRLKNFPDYKQLTSVQTCLSSQGIEFTGKQHLEGDVKAKISKLFILEEPESGFYMDFGEDHKGYFTHSGRLAGNDFERIMHQIKNNGNCKLFDAVQGEILKEGKILEIIRIYSEELDLNQLKCIKKEFEKLR